MKKQNGITLISLIITIIVMLILAGVALSMVIGDGSVLEQANSAVNNTKIAEVKEEISLAIGNNKVAKFTGQGAKTAAEVAQKLIDDGKVTDYDATNKTVVVAGTTISLAEIDEVLNGETSGTTPDEDTPVIGTTGATFTDGTSLTWDELKLASNGTKYGYTASALTDTAIGANAFRACDSITSIVIPEGIKTIGNSAFYNCYSLEDVTFPNGLETIGNSAFSEMGLQTAVLPDTLKSIGTSAFWDNGITTINIPASVTYIGSNALFHMENINVDSNNQNYASLDGVLYNKSMTTLIKYPYSKSSAYVMPDSVTTISGSAFSSDYGPKSITINNNVIVDASTFDEAFGIEAIYVKSGNTKYASVDGVLYNANKTKLIRYPYSKSNSTFTVPNSVTEIEGSAFNQCYGPENIIFTKEVNVEGFAECPFVTITFPATISSNMIYALTNSGGMNLITINYGGTKAQWNALELDERWTEWLEYRPLENIVCSDGTIAVR